MLYPENTKPTWDCKFLFLRVLCIIVTKLKLNSMYGLYCIFYFGIVWTDTIMHISELMDHWGSWHTVVVSANTVTATIFAGLCQAACTLTTRGHLISTDAIYRTSCIFFFVEYKAVSNWTRWKGEMIDSFPSGSKGIRYAFTLAQAGPM